MGLLKSIILVKLKNIDIFYIIGFYRFDSSWSLVKLIEKLKIENDLIKNFKLYSDFYFSILILNIIVYENYIY